MKPLTETDLRILRNQKRSLTDERLIMDARRLTAERRINRAELHLIINEIARRFVPEEETQ